MAVLQAQKFLQEQDGFWLLKPKTKEKKHFKSALILGNDSERWIVPDASLMPIEDVSFEDFEQSIRAINIGVDGGKLDKSKLFRLWGTLIKKAYAFVPRDVQNEKLKEARRFRC